MCLFMCALIHFYVHCSKVRITPDKEKVKFFKKLIELHNRSNSFWMLLDRLVACVEVMWWIKIASADITR